MKTLLTLCFAVTGFAGLASAQDATPSNTLPSTVRINETVVVERGHRHSRPYHHRHMVRHHRRAVVVHTN